MLVFLCGILRTDRRLLRNLQRLVRFFDSSSHVSLLFSL